jgi:hypothetical protein
MKRRGYAERLEWLGDNWPMMMPFKRQVSNEELLQRVQHNLLESLVHLAKVEVLLARYLP